YAVLYGKREGLLALPGINHFFVREDDIPYKFQPGNANYEFTYATAAIVDYLEDIGRQPSGSSPSASSATRELLISAYEQFAIHEQMLCARLLGFLNQKEGVIVLGDRRSDSSVRVATLSFVVKGRDSREIVNKADRLGLGIRCGDLYARRLYDAAGLDA